MHERFECSDTWADYDVSDNIKFKAKLLAEIIPSDVKTIIDVGCGNGIITNMLASKWDVIGLDSSEEALKYVKAPTVKASATDIPFPDHKFDLVLCSEMLEHLSDELLDKAVKELMRVSGKYLLITVPNHEYLEASFAMCPNCHRAFHVWHHYQSFSKKRLITLFDPNFKTTFFKLTGPSIKEWMPILLRTKHYLGQWMEIGRAPVCPYCGNKRFNDPLKNVATKVINGLNLLLSGNKPYWMVVLFQRNSR